MKVTNINSFNSDNTLKIADKTYHYFDLKKAEAAGLSGASSLPKSLKVLLENLLRFEDGKSVTKADIEAVVAWLKDKHSDNEISYRPARVLMQDFTGVPAVVDLAAMRDAMVALKADPKKINPLSPVDLVIDHSVQVDHYGSNKAFAENVDIEMQRNHERYGFLRWGQKAFEHFRVVPPGTGICHQVNLEYLAKVAWSREIDDKTFVYPDTLVGTDSHTTMINGLGVLGWGVGGIEAEAAMLGQPISMLIPEVIGFRLEGALKDGITATDLVLTVTEMLREKGVVGKFVEFFGPGLDHLPLADRATIANMAPEYGATCGFFPVDDETLRYMTLSGRDDETIALTEAYAKAQGLWRDESQGVPEFTDTMSLDMSKVEPSLAGPKRPQDRVNLKKLPKVFDALYAKSNDKADIGQAFPVRGSDFAMHHGDIVIAAITSCTNTSNPSVMLAAGLVAKKAAALGLNSKPWVKTSLAPGSKVVTDYLEKSELQPHLDQIGFNLVGYGCATCIGNSGPLHEDITQTIEENNLMVSAVLSGNRNFEGRVHPLTKANWLASPPLVVAYALAGSTRLDLGKDVIAQDKDGKDVFLKDIWPTSQEVAAEVAKVNKEMFRTEYADVFSGDKTWQAIKVADSDTCDWQADSTYIQNPPFFEGMGDEPDAISEIHDARILALLGDSVTTDHISPAGNIKADSPAGRYLSEHGVEPENFNSFGSRRGNHEVMMRGTFGNIRIRNEMLKGIEGGMTKHQPEGKIMPIYDAAMLYQDAKTPLVVIAGKDYGMGSSRDWAAKGTILLGVKAVIAESYERIHRSNLIGMGVLPLQFKKGVTRKSLKLDGTETISVEGFADHLAPGVEITVLIKRADGQQESIKTTCRIDTQNEFEYYRHGGILRYVLRQLKAGV
jgi:aconitate hydratase